MFLRFLVLNIHALIASKSVVMWLPQAHLGLKTCRRQVLGERATLCTLSVQLSAASPQLLAQRLRLARSLPPSRRCCFKLAIPCVQRRPCLFEIASQPATNIEVDLDLPVGVCMARELVPEIGNTLF